MERGASEANPRTRRRERGRDRAPPPLLGPLRQQRPRAAAVFGRTKNAEQLRAAIPCENTLSASRIALRAHFSKRGRMRMNLAWGPCCVTLHDFYAS